MFVQMIRGRIDDIEGLRRQLDVWMRDHAPAAEGWLGSTAGVTDDGEAVAVVRFSSAEAAQRNSERPEQGQWWSETEQLFDGPVAFADYPDSALLLGGGSDDAGFVQAMQGRTTDLERLNALQQEMGDRLHELRPEILGGTYAWDDQGRVLQVAYFASEAEAREGEARMEEAPADFRAAFEEFQKLTSETRYFDLRDPWAWSPAS